MPEIMKITSELGGLRKSFESPLNSPGLADCRAWRPSHERLGIFRQITEFIEEAELTAHSITVLHPFPQIFVSAGFALLCTEDRVFAVDLALRTLTEYDYWNADTLEATTITAGGVWHFADYGEGFFLFNGVSTVFLRDGLLLVEEGISIQTGCYYRGRVLLAGFDPSFTWKKGWDWVVGKLLATDKAAYEKLSSLALEGLGPNMVWWPSIGGGDLFSLFYPEYAISGHFILTERLNNRSFATDATGWDLTNVSHSSGGLVKMAGSVGTAVQTSANMLTPVAGNRKYLLKFELSAVTAGTVKFALGAVESETFASAGVHICYLTSAATNDPLTITFSSAAAMRLENISLRRVVKDHTDPVFSDAHSLNQQGWWRVDHEGTIIALKQLGSAVIVYGTTGISALLHYAAPVPTFGEKVLARVGVADRGAIGGSDYEHVFLDSSGKAWKIDAELHVVELGWEEYLAALVGQPVTISHDSREGEYRLTGRNADEVPLPFVLVGENLARSPEVVTSALFLDGEFTGLREPTLVENVALIQTGVYDLETRLVKHLLGLEFAFSGGGVIEASILHRIGANDFFDQTPWTVVDVNGYCRLPVSCIEFAVLFRVSSFELVQKLDQITVYYDLRGKLNARNAFGA